MQKTQAPGHAFQPFFSGKRGVVAEGVSTAVRKIVTWRCHSLSLCLLLSAKVSVYFWLTYPGKAGEHAEDTDLPGLTFQLFFGQKRS